jgi:hypothetical protein
MHSIASRSRTFSVMWTTLGLTHHAGLVTSPTTIFTSKVATLGAAQLAGSTIRDFQLQDDIFSIIFNTGAGKLKLQTKDGAQGGLFQMETEFASNVEFIHVLGPTLFYFLNSVTGKINFGNGIVCTIKSTLPCSYRSAFSAPPQKVPANLHFCHRMQTPRTECSSAKTALK